jgi:hypothetical protein
MLGKIYACSLNLLPTFGKVGFLNKKGLYFYNAGLVEVRFLRVCEKSDKKYERNACGIRRVNILSAARF